MDVARRGVRGLIECYGRCPRRCCTVCNRGASCCRFTGRDRPSESVDGIAARIEDDIITESEVRELAAFQAWWMANPNRAPN